MLIQWCEVLEKVRKFILPLRTKRFVIMSDETSWQKWKDCGNLNFKAKKYKAAIEDFDRAIALNNGEAVRIY